MDGLLELPKEVGQPEIQFSAVAQTNITIDKLIVIPDAQPRPTVDKVDLHFDDLYKALSITARKVIDRIDELLQEHHCQQIHQA